MNLWTAGHLSDEPISFQYSHKYHDDQYEYRHVTFPRWVTDSHPTCCFSTTQWLMLLRYRYMAHILKELQDTQKLLDEREWRQLGIVQSRGWEHYEYHL